MNGKILTPPRCTLFHGSPTKREDGEFLIPHRQKTMTGDEGEFVFASHIEGFAIMFGLANRFTSKPGIETVGNETFPYTILRINKGDSFEEILCGKSYLHTVHSKGFFGVCPKGSPDGTLPLEWLSQNKAKVIGVAEYNNRDLLRFGIQVFTMNAQAYDSLIDGRVSLWDIKRLYNLDLLEWENEREEFCGEPYARPLSLLKLLKPDAKSGPTRVRLPQSSFIVREGKPSLYTPRLLALSRA